MLRTANSPLQEASRSRQRETTPTITLPANTLSLQPLPRWTRDQGEEAINTSGAAFAAGAALFALDQVIRADPPWLGALHMRQALAAAEASARLLRLREDAPALRDAHHLTRTGDDPGPAGRLHRAWLELARRPARSDAERLDRLAQNLGLSLPAGSLDRIAVAEAGDPITLAADVAGRVVETVASARRPESEVLGLMVADLALALRLGWPVTIPLLAAAVLQPGLRRGGERRPRPGEPGWAALCFAAYARAARDAHSSALDLSRRTERLVARSTQVRTRGGRDGVAILLGDDAVSTAALTGLGSDRAARRFLERLAALGAIREFTGRPAFRLYGL